MVEYVVNSEHKHFVGMYTGQFECYERALAASGKKVLAKVVYYATLGGWGGVDVRSGVFLKFLLSCKYGAKKWHKN